MLQHLDRSIAWFGSRREWWLALALVAAYALLLVNGDGAIRAVAVCALPVTGALLLAAIGKHHASTFAILSAAALVPPAVVMMLYIITPRPLGAHACSMGPLIALGVLVLGGAQVAVMAVLATLFRGIALFVQQRRARAQ